MLVPPLTGVLVLVAVGGIGVLVLVAVGPTDVFVGGMNVTPGVFVLVAVGTVVGLPVPSTSARSSVMVVPELLAFFVPVTRIFSVWLPAVSVALVYLSTWPVL